SKARHQMAECLIDLTLIERSELAAHRERLFALGGRSRSLRGTSLGGRRLAAPTRQSSDGQSEESNETGRSSQWRRKFLTSRSIIVAGIRPLNLTRQAEFSLRRAKLARRGLF